MSDDVHELQKKLAASIKELSIQTGFMNDMRKALEMIDTNSLMSEQLMREVARNSLRSIRAYEKYLEGKAFVEGYEAQYGKQNPELLQS